MKRKNNDIINDSDLKLIYILKIGNNSKNEGLYEFLFSRDETDIDYMQWGWNINPANDNAQPPSLEKVDEIVSLKTKSFDLFCLHEANDREYMHGYYTIHALAYEIEKTDEDGYDSYDDIFSDDSNQPLLVFHYGVTLDKVKSMLMNRNFRFKNNEFLEIESIDFND